MQRDPQALESLAVRLARHWPLPPEQLDALRSSPAWAAIACAASAPGGLDPPTAIALADMEAAIRDLFAARLLPLTDAARRALDRALPAFEEMARVADLSRLPQSVADARGALDAAAEAALDTYRDEMARLARHRAALDAAGPRAGMSPFVSAVEAIAPASAAVLGYVETRRAFAAHVDAAAAHCARAQVAPVPRLAASVKHVELARYHERFLRHERPGRPLVPEFVPLHAAGNLLDRLNAVYYALRGSAIYDDFVTAASLDSLLARADAATARAWFVGTPAGRAGGPMRVLEVGVGDGAFAAGFLDELALQDAAAGHEDRAGGPLHPRTRYVLGDISPRMLEDALAHPALARHADRIEVDLLDGPGRGARTFDLQRYHELFDDLPGGAILYVDPAGRVHAAELRGTWPEGEPPTRRDGRPLDPVELGSWIAGGDLEALRGLREDVLARIEWEVRFVPVAPETLPYGEVLPDLLGTARDVLVPLAIGAARFLEECLDRAAPGGMIRVFDYGVPSVASAPTSYVSAAQVVRRYGASSTRNVVFSLLEAVARRRGATVRLVPQEALIAEAGVTAVQYRPLAGLGPERVSRACSHPDAPFPLQRLREWEAVRSVVLSLGDDPARYLELVSRLEAQGLVTLGLPPAHAPRARGLLECLASDLDFAVAAAFAPAAVPALRRQRAWLDDPRALAGVARRLEAIGFAATDDEGGLDVPPSGQLWMLEVVTARPFGGSPREYELTRNAAGGSMSLPSRQVSRGRARRKVSSQVRDLPHHPAATPFARKTRPTSRSKPSAPRASCRPTACGPRQARQRGVRHGSALVTWRLRPCDDAASWPAAAQRADSRPAIELTSPRETKGP